MIVDIILSNYCSLFAMPSFKFHFLLSLAKGKGKMPMWTNGGLEVLPESDPPRKKYKTSLFPLLLNKNGSQAKSIDIF